MDECIFCKIAKKQIPKEFIYEDEQIMVLPDIRPVRRVHLLIIPKQHIAELLAVSDPKLFSDLIVVVKNMIKREGLSDKGYRITINGGGAQAIDHLHIHLSGPLSKTVPI